MVDGEAVHDWLIEQIRQDAGTYGSYWLLEAYLRVGDQFRLRTPAERGEITTVMSRVSARSA